MWNISKTDKILQSQNKSQNKQKLHRIYKIFTVHNIEMQSEHRTLHSVTTAVHQVLCNWPFLISLIMNKFNWFVPEPNYWNGCSQLVIISCQTCRPSGDVDCKVYNEEIVDDLVADQCIL